MVCNQENARKGVFFVIPGPDSTVLRPPATKIERSRLQPLPVMPRSCYSSAPRETEQFKAGQKERRKRRVVAVAVLKSQVAEIQVDEKD
jgi:hypothetical protein